MQDKKTVLFLVPEKSIVKMLEVKNEFEGETEYACVVIDEKIVRCLWKNRVFDKLCPTESKRRRIYRSVRKKLFAKKNKSTFGDACGLPEKTVRNMLYRFVPDIVVVSTEEALDVLIRERKTLNMKYAVGILHSSSNVILRDETDYYFVSNFIEKNALVDKGVLPEKVVYGLYPFDPVQADKFSLRQEFGVSDFLIVVCPASNMTDEVDKMLSEERIPDTEIIYYCQNDEMRDTIEKRGGRTEDRAVIGAADVMLAYDRELLDEAEEQDVRYIELPREDFRDELKKIIERKSSKTGESAVFAEMLRKLLSKMKEQQGEKE